MVGILLENDEISINNGTIQIGDNRMDIIERVVDSNIGEWKEDTTIGVGIANMMNGTNNEDIIRVKIIENIEKNNIDYEKVTVDSGEINVYLKQQ